MRKLKSLFINLSLTLLSFFYLFLFFEFIVFRFIFVATDQPKLDYSNSIVKFQAEQQGNYKVKNVINAKYSINSNGWNSAHSAYVQDKDPVKSRIAIIGDSYVSAFEVPYTLSVAEQLELNLGKDKVEVYRFGINGAPLSQYLHMFRKEVVNFKPDLLILTLIHNDFDESYKFRPGVYDSSFMKLKIKNGEVVDEIPPIPYKDPWYNPIRNSATWRYLANQQGIRFSFLRELILSSASEKNNFQANIDTNNLGNDMQNNQLATDYVLHEFKELCVAESIKLLVIMDGDRDGIYHNIDTDSLYDKGALQLNRIASIIAKKYDIDFIDLHSIFKNDYLKNKKRFNTKVDGHWNEYGHELVATTLSNHIQNSRN